MKKTLLITLLALFNTIAVLAQNDDPPIMEDFANGIKGSNAFAFNEHLNIMQISTGDESFDLVAVNDKLQVVWRTSLAGFGIKTDKFKGKIVALASTTHSNIKGTNNTFEAYVVDPDNGKVLVDKIVYKSDDDYVEYRQMYTGDGAFFKLAVRQTGYRRKIHIGIPFYDWFSDRYAREYNETRKLQVVEYNDKLDSVSSFKPVRSNGLFVSLSWNKHADMFISWLNGPSIEVYKYDAGKTTPSNQLTVPVSFEIKDSAIPSRILFTCPSDNSNVLYYGLIYRNQDKDAELGIGKLDFEGGKKAYVSQVIDKASLKALKKGFVPINKKVDDIDMGYAGGMNIKYITEADGKLLVALSANAIYSSQAGSTFYIEYSLIVNAYDKDLNLRFQQVFPASSYYPNRQVSTGFHVAKNKLYLVANSKKGMRSNVGVFGILDLSNGQWLKTEELSKKHISNIDYSEGPSVLWFGDSYIVPYFSQKMFSAVKSDVTLQLNNY
jgi:hypothetical protein